jgi:hypothetical protein
VIHYYKTLNKTERQLYWLGLAIILVGAVLRIIVWAQNRDLIIDEANIARNLYERGFAQLAQPLSYEQYAPIFFLWVEKTATVLLGFSEQALKVFPLLSGIAALYVAMLVFKEYASLKVAWYPLALFAFSHFFIRYSTEVKQYMSDALVVLLLVYFALKISIDNTTNKRFVVYWILIGTLAIMSAMPSVFALTGVGGYYFWQAWRGKKYDKMRSLFLVGFIWVAEFALYYTFLLKDQAHSEYLQKFHANYFLVATPGTMKEWLHNWNVCTELISLPTGYALSSKLFNYSLLAFGSILLLFKDTAKGVLVLLPIFFTLFAGAINEYSMIPRVVLFLMPLFLVIIGYGIEFFVSMRPMVMRLAFAGMALAVVLKHNAVDMAWVPYHNEQITWAMKLQQDNGIDGAHLHVSNGSTPAFIYYTQIHPGRQRWDDIKDAHQRTWDMDWKRLAVEANGKFGAIFTTIPEAEAAQRRSEMRSAAKLVASIEDPEAKCYAYVFEK